MDRRSRPLQSFVDAAEAAFTAKARDPASRSTVGAVFDALRSPRPSGDAEGERLPVCAHLEDALRPATARPALDGLVRAFRELEPSLVWRRRADNGTASENFGEGHANTMVLGPGGREERRDVWVGATLMAPNTRYPDHDHAPEEVYLVLSDGEFRQGTGEGFRPGIGGSFYNEPKIRHTMRALDTPLFAFWILRTDDAAGGDL